MVINQLLGRFADSVIDHEYPNIAFRDDNDENTVYIEVDDSYCLNNLVLPLCDDESQYKATSMGVNSAEVKIGKSSNIEGKFELKTITLYKNEDIICVCSVAESILQAVSEACMDDKYFKMCEELVAWSE